MGHIKKPKHLKSRAMTEDKKHATKNKIEINHITSLNPHGEPT